MTDCNLCRICVTEDTATQEMIPLFDEMNTDCAEIVTHIQECSGVLLVKKKDFPNKICLQCFELLNNARKFRSLCQASENAVLRYIIKNECADDALVSKQSTPAYLHTEFIDSYKAKLQGTNECETKNELKYVYKSATTDQKSINYKTKRIFTAHSKIKKRSPLLCSKSLEIKNLKWESFTFMCEICGNKYYNEGLLNLHKRIHTREKAFECEICKKKFDFSSSKSRHMRVHTKEKPYICKYCGRRFADHSTNIKHERTHTNSRPFTCKTCGKSFTYSNVLKSHVLIHTGEKAFKCSVCNKSFSRKHELTQHCSTIIHKETMENLLQLC